MKKSRSNPKYLGDFKFPDLLSLSDNFNEAVTKLRFYFISNTNMLDSEKALKAIKNH